MSSDQESTEPISKLRIFGAILLGLTALLAAGLFGGVIELLCLFAMVVLILA